LGQMVRLEYLIQNSDELSFKLCFLKDEKSGVSC